MMGRYTVPRFPSMQFSRTKTTYEEASDSIGSVWGTSCMTGINYGAGGANNLEVFMLLVLENDLYPRDNEPESKGIN